MNWHNLDKNKCPECGKDFTETCFINPKLIVCTNCHNFKIRPERMKEIIEGNGLNKFKPVKHYRPSDENPE